MRNPNLLFIFVENASFKNRLESDKDLVTIWDSPVKSDTGFEMFVCELTMIDYQIMSAVSRSCLVTKGLKIYYSHF